MRPQLWDYLTIFGLGFRGQVTAHRRRRPRRLRRHPPGASGDGHGVYVDVAIESIREQLFEADFGEVAVLFE